MADVIVACRTIENELRAAMSQTDCSLPVIWLASGLHNWPRKLNASLQECLDGCTGYGTVLLAMGFCGNSLVGLHTRCFELIVPRCEDCISLLLGPAERRREFSGTYFLTEGWLKGERTLWEEYRVCVRKYGKARGKNIFAVMLANYHKLALLDTGCFDHEKAAGEVHRIANALGLQYAEINGTLDYIKALLQRNWSEERFLRIPPHSTVSYEDCTI